MITQDETYVAVKGEDGLDKMTEKRFNSENEKRAKEGKPSLELVFTQAFRKQSAETLAEAQELCADEKVAVTYFNRGYGLRLESLISDLITDTEFQMADGIFDLRDDASKLPTRTGGGRKKQLSAEDLIGLLRGLPQDELAKIIGSFNAVGATA